MRTEFLLNGETVIVDTPEDATLLWTLRERLNLTGTKYGCGISSCGACTIHLDGSAVRSCSTPVSVAAGREITTIEGLSSDNNHPLQKAFQQEQVPQCGYCQSGQIMQAAAMLKSNPSPSDDEIVNQMNGVLCRCGTYTRILKAIKKASQEGLG